MSLSDDLMMLGLSEYEARVYISLVKLGKGNAREIHEASGVPRTKVYEVLKRLLEKGFLEIQEGSPTHYRAIEPRKVIGKLQEDITSVSKRSINELENLKTEKQKEMPLIWVVRGDWTIKARIRELLGEAESDVTIKCTDTNILQEISDQLIGLDEKVKVNCLLLQEDAQLMDKLSHQVEFKVVDKTRLKEPFFDGLIQIMEGIEEEGVEFKIECLLIVDGKKSVIVLNEDSKRLAALIRLPIIVYLQKNSIDAVWEKLG